VTVLTETLARALEWRLLVEQLAECIEKATHDEDNQGFRDLARASGNGYQWIIEHYVGLLVRAAGRALTRDSVLAGLDAEPVAWVGLTDLRSKRDWPEVEADARSLATLAQSSVREAVFSSWNQVETLLRRIDPTFLDWKWPLDRYGSARLSAALRLTRKVNGLFGDLVRSLPTKVVWEGWSEKQVRLVDEVFAKVLRQRLNEATPAEAGYLLEFAPDASGQTASLGVPDGATEAVQSVLPTLLWRALEGITAMEPDDFEGITSWGPYRTECVPVVLALLNDARRGGSRVGDPFDWFVILGDMFEDRRFRFSQESPGAHLGEVIEAVSQRIGERTRSDNERGSVAREIARLLTLKNIPWNHVDRRKTTRDGRLSHTASWAFKEIAG
jgi:hypothetical protein